MIFFKYLIRAFITEFAVLRYAFDVTMCIQAQVRMTFFGDGAMTVGIEFGTPSFTSVHINI